MAWRAVARGRCRMAADYYGFWSFFRVFDVNVALCTSALGLWAQWLVYSMMTLESYIIIIIGSHSAGNASHRPQHYSPTRRLAGRRHEHRPAFRPREPLLAGAARRAHLDDVLNIFQEPLAGTLKFSYHFLTSTHFHSPAAMPAPTRLNLSHAHAQAACARPHASHTHTMRPCRRVCDLVACDSM